MSKSKLKVKKDHIVYVNKIKFPETIHERALQILNANLLEGFLPVEVERKKMKAKITCKAEGVVQASKYLGQATDKIVFLDFIAQLIERITTCNKNYINPNNIAFSLDTIFVIPHAGSVRCVFWPMVNNNDYVLPKDFFKKLPDKVNFAPGQDMSFLHKYNLFFNGIDPFSILNFKNLIMELAGQEVQTHKFSPESKLLQASIEQANAVTNENIGDASYDIFSQLNQNVGSAELDEHTTINQGTTILDASGNSNANSSYVALVSASGKRYDIDITPFSIGKDSSMNLQLKASTISRHHADIVYSEDAYYLVDANSTNCTYLNGEPITPKEYYELAGGDTVHFAKTKFTFSL